MRCLFAKWMLPVLLFLGPSGLRAETPVVQRVEPPNWWVGHSHNPVRVLFTGTNLTGVNIAAADGLSVSNITVSETGGYAFADVFIAPHAKTGPRALKLESPQGRTTASFEVTVPVPRENRFTGFSSDDVIYLLMPDRFANGDLANDDPPESPGLLDRSKPRHYHGGDLQGVINQLPYLQDLGVTALWLTPWYDNVNHLNTKERYTTDNQRSARGAASTDYHGYGAVDFYAVEERLGDLPKLQELVGAAQARGVKIIQDQVANHTGPYHPWAQHPPTPTWFNGTPEKHIENEWQIWTVADPNAPADKLKSTLEGWFINILPDLNQNDPETATYLIQNSLWWIGMTGLDAVRQDTLPYVPRQYWAQWTAALKKEYPHLTILGELWDGKPELVAFFQGGRKQFDGVDTGVDTLFDFPLYYAIRDVFAKRQPMTRLAQTIAADTNYVDARHLVTFLGLHDTARFMSEPGATRAGLKLAFTYLFTARGTPMIYYGDEIAMTGGNDPHNRAGFPGGWPDDPRNAFHSDGRTPEEERVHAHLRKLAKLRRELEPLRRGEYRDLAVSAGSYAFARVTPQASVVVAFNNTGTAQTLDLNLAPANLGNVTGLKDQLHNKKLVVREGRVRLQLPPFTAAILTPDGAALAASE
jgi:neopullulanase